MRSRSAAVTLLAVALIAIGIIAFVFEGITYTRSKTILDVGPLKAQVEEKRTIPLSPVLGALAIAGGITLLIFVSRPSPTA